MGWGHYDIRAKFDAPGGGTVVIIEAAAAEVGRAGGHYPALLDLGLGVGRLAAQAGVSFRGPDVVAQAISRGEERYLVANFKGEGEAGGLGSGQVVAAARVKPTQYPRMPGLLGLRRLTVPLVSVEVLEAADGGLLPLSSGEDEGDERRQRGRKAAAGILCTLAAAPDVSGGCLRVKGRFGRDFDNSDSSDPRDRAFFEELGFQVPKGMPPWGKLDSVMIATANTVVERAAEIYSLSLPSA